MKCAVLACCLVIFAGVCALPQQSDVAVGGVCALPQQSDVAPTQERIVDLWLTYKIEKLSRVIKEKGLDPIHKKRLDFEYDLLHGLVAVEGVLESLKLSGLSYIVLKHAHYNILRGRLEFHICMPELHLSVGKFRARGVIGDRGGELTVAGSLKVCDICIRGNALLHLKPGTATLININVNFSVGSIDSNVKVIWKRLGCLIPRDLSNYVNILLNVKIPLYLDKYQNQINTIVGVIIRCVVSYWPW